MICHVALNFHPTPGLLPCHRSSSRPLLEWVSPSNFAPARASGGQLTVLCSVRPFPINLIRFPQRSRRSFGRQLSCQSCHAFQLHASPIVIRQHSSVVEAVSLPAGISLLPIWCIDIWWSLDDTILRVVISYCTFAALPPPLGWRNSLDGLAIQCLLRSIWVTTWQSGWPAPAARALSLRLSHLSIAQTHCLAPDLWTVQN